METTQPRKLRPNVQQALEDLRRDPRVMPITEPPLRRVRKIQFGIMSPEEIQALAVCEVRTSRVTNPPVDTVYDERMGPSSSRGICQTCLEDLRVCPGHLGFIKLSIPVIHPLFVKFIVLILNCICLKCSNLKMSKDEIAMVLGSAEQDRSIRSIDKPTIIQKKCSSVTTCSKCQTRLPTTVKEVEGSIYMVYEIPKSKQKKQSLLEITELQEILARVSSDDLEVIGFPYVMRNIYLNGREMVETPTFRPEWLILTHLPVIPPLARPPDNEGDQRSDDDLTTSYADIVKYNLQIGHPKKEGQRVDPMQMLGKQIRGLFDNSNGEVTRSSGKVSKGLKERISGKQGHIRGRLMGKRVDCSSRTVITADPNLRLNQVGVPEEIAKVLSFPEKVTRRNIQELSDLLEAGKINTIVRGAQHIRVAYAQSAGRQLRLRFGDVAYRHMRDGDTVVFNRQPTLHRGSMMAHYVKILPGKTFRLNLSVTTPYNADFDGRHHCHQQGN